MTEPILDPAPELDPRAIRLSLELSREGGMAFDQAWREATDDCCDTDGDRKFMRKHFEAAYYRHDSPLGRCLVPERDVSGAIGAERSGISVHPRCRWGGGCDRLAIRGTFGLRWCEDHGADLARIGRAA